MNASALRPVVEGHRAAVLGGVGRRAYPRSHSGSPTRKPWPEVAQGLPAALWERALPGHLSFTFRHPQLLAGSLLSQACVPDSSLCSDS